MPPIDFDDDDILDEGVSDYGDFDEWFEDFKCEARNLGYNRQRFDKYAFEEDYLQGKTPYAAAKEFVDEMNS